MMRDLSEQAYPRQSIEAVDEVTCFTCGYDLRGIEREGRCPECGFDVEKSEYCFDRYDDLRKMSRAYYKHSVYCFIGVILSVLFLFLSELFLVWMPLGSTPQHDAATVVTTILLIVLLLCFAATGIDLVGGTYFKVKFKLVLRRVKDESIKSQFRSGEVK
ncbi:hypothetical protein JD969_02015 [Planctomycetota bacterium]|nr:hypothetical protein JD969_02015 [Planctomycetota bacterium]